MTTNEEYWRSQDYEDTWIGTEDDQKSFLEMTARYVSGDGGSAEVLEDEPQGLSGSTTAQWPKWRGQKELSGNDKFESSGLIFAVKYFMKHESLERIWIIRCTVKI